MKRGTVSLRNKPHGRRAREGEGGGGYKVIGARHVTNETGMYSTARRGTQKDKLPKRSVSSNLERRVVSVKVNAAVSRVVEPLVEPLEVLKCEVGNGGGIATGVHAVGVVREDGLRERICRPKRHQ